MARIEERPVVVRAEEARLDGVVAVPEAARGIVLFAHGSGSSRLSPRNAKVARELNDANIATLLFDLLTADEERIDLRTQHLRFDIDLLARRMVGATDWVLSEANLAGLTVGYFGASTGAAAALVAASRRPETVAAVVSRGGRPDLADDALSLVRAPTLLIVGGHDELVIDLNRGASARMSCINRLEVVLGATHLFEEPGTLDRVIRLATAWFTHWFERAQTSHQTTEPVP